MKRKLTLIGVDSTEFGKNGNLQQNQTIKQTAALYVSCHWKSHLCLADNVVYQNLRTQNPPHVVAHHHSVAKLTAIKTSQNLR